MGRGIAWMCVHLVCCVCFFDDLGGFRDHLGEDGATGSGKALGMCLLQKPELFEGNDGVATGDFQVELVVLLNTSGCG